MGDGCYFCEDGEDLEEHHILPQRFEGSDAESNVVDVCHECHWKLERLYNKDFWNALGIDDPRATQEKHVNCYWDQCQEHAVKRLRVGNDKGEYTLAYYCPTHAERRLKNGKVRAVDVTDDHENNDENEDEPELGGRHGVDTDELEYSRETEKRIERLTDHYE